MSKKKNGSVLLFNGLDNLSFAEIEADEDGYKAIPIFREGAFEHPWYGNLDFNLEYLNKIVENHGKAVMPAQISFDQSHNPDLGALAWVKPGPDGLYTEQVTYNNSLGKPVTKTFLFAMIKMTKTGQQKIEDEEFKYFSSEINPDYSTREVVEIEREGGGYEYSTISHGPVLVGGGFTNRPFIPNLGEAFSENGQPLEKNEMHTVTRNDDNTFFFSDAVKLKEPSVPAVEEEVEENSVELTDPIGENGMNFSEVIAKLAQFSEPADKAKYLEETLPSLSENDKVVAESMLNAQREAAKFSKLAADATHKAGLAESKAADLNEKVINLSNDLLASKEVGYQEKVNAFCAGIRNDGHAESVVNVVAEVLAGVKPSNRDIKFSSVAEDGSEVSFDIFEAITKIFNALPEEAVAIQQPAFTNDVTEVEPPQANEEFKAPEDKPEPTPEQVAEAAKVQKFTEIHGREPHEAELGYIGDDGYIDPSKLNETNQ